MISFEIIDNMFQISVLLICFMASAILAIKYKKQIYIALSGVYGSFMIGTLFYCLHLIIIGGTPHISYCAEISWLASFLFMMQIILQRAESRHKSFSWKAAACAILVMCSSLYNEMLGPSLIFVIAFTAVSGISVFVSVRTIEVNRKNGEAVSCLDYFIPGIICLDMILYFVSSFYSDYTHFNLYFAIDILITVSLGMMLIFYIREERHAG